MQEKSFLSVNNTGKEATGPRKKVSLAYVLAAASLSTHSTEAQEQP